MDGSAASAGAIEEPTTFATIMSTEMPIGSIITAVAVFETHIDMKPVAIMKPAIIGPGLLPMRLSVKSAMRRWRFHRCIDRAMRNPPRKRKMIGLP